jgi:hypothetical protein
VTFADLKNDFVFRRIFASHADLLRTLLNDLLERSGDRAIDSIEYLPSEQLPLVVGAKLSILDVRCKDRTGTTFVVEMQLVHVAGFINRVVYNACKAYAGQLREAQRYTQLTDVVAISICDFELWPDAEQRAQGLPLVPMLSRWNMTERKSGNHGMLRSSTYSWSCPSCPPRSHSSPAPICGPGCSSTRRSSLLSRRTSRQGRTAPRSSSRTRRRSRRGSSMHTAA